MPADKVVRKLGDFTWNYSALLMNSSLVDVHVLQHDRTPTRIAWSSPRSTYALMLR